MLRSCLAVCASTLVVMGVVGTSALAAPGFQGEHAMAPDVDARDGRVAPSARQRSLAVRACGSRGTASARRTRWRRRSGYLATGLSSDNATAARQWIARNRALLGIGATDLELVTATDHAVLLRQTLRRRAGRPRRPDRRRRQATAGSPTCRRRSRQDDDITGARDIGAAAAVREAARRRAT